MQSKRSVGSGSGRGGDRSSGRSAAARPSATRAPSGAGGDGRDAIARTADALGYELVDVERLAGGLLRVTIDRVAGRTYPGAAGPDVTVDDCEAVTRQLQYLLEVEGVDYGRLEVSSPGLDRPLKRASDWARFCGEAVEVTLHEAFDGRKRWRGVLVAPEAGAPAGSWRLELHDEPAKPGPGARGRPRRAGAAKRPVAAAAPAARALDFTLDEVREARLVPVIDFKGRRGDVVADAAPTPPPAVEPAAPQNKTATE